MPNTNQTPKKPKEALIETNKIKMFFPLKRQSFFTKQRFYVRAVEDVSIKIYKGETLGLVGESGCGKSTLGRIILQLYKPTSGSSVYYGVPLREVNPKYVLKEIKRLPKYQSNASKFYQRSLKYDALVEQLHAQLKEAQANYHEELSADDKARIEAKIAELTAQRKTAIQRVELACEEGIANYKEVIERQPNRYVQEGWEQEVRRFIKNLKEGNDEVPFDSQIQLLHMPYKKVLMMYRKVMQLDKQLAKANIELQNIGRFVKLEKQIAKAQRKSKELKKEASRQLREGSRTAGDLILEREIGYISKLMLEEELLHRENCDLKKRKEQDEHVKAKITKNEKRQAEIVEELEHYHRREVLDITERCCEVEYQDKMEANRETGLNLQRLDKHEMRKLRQKLQIIFQDPYSSLDPRMTVGQAISEAVVEHGLYKKGSKELEDYIVDTMARCGLDHYMIHRYPHQFSGGQRQRIVIARALALNPEFIVCDESVSALDVSIQSQILNLLQELKEKNNLTYLFISHDLSVIKHISDRIGVMYLGNMVELCDSEKLYENPLHPYSKALISAIPTTTKNKYERIILEGDIPSNIFPPSGCKFRTRCPLARAKCAKEQPVFREVEPHHFVACHFYEETKTKM